MPENLHTKNINTYEQTLNINIKPLQATYKHPAPSTPLLYIFSPTASSPTCPKWAILGCGNLDSATTQRFFRLVHHSPRYFALRPPCQKLQGHESSLQRHTLKFHMSTDLFLGSNVRNGILSLLCLDAMKFNQKYAWPNYDNGSHLSNTLSTNTSPGIRKNTVTSRRSPNAKAFRPKVSKPPKTIQHTESFHNQHGSKSINAVTC